MSERGGVRIYLISAIMMCLLAFIGCGSKEDRLKKELHGRASDAVLEILKAPSTATISSFDENSVVVAGRFCAVTLTVDSQNAFGAMLRSKFDAGFWADEGDAMRYRLANISKKNPDGSMETIWQAVPDV